MKTILITAYAVNPLKGSEDAMGWNFILQAARFNKIIAFTRKNNSEAIEQYKLNHPEQKELFSKIDFRYFDWPYIFRFWKKGPLLSMIYYYGWQLTLSIKLLSARKNADIVHNLNFHNDWTPSFLWLLGKPFVWGPIGHHPLIPKKFILPVYGKKEFIKDRALWMLKNIFWRLDPWLWITKKKASAIICMNSQPSEKLLLKNGNYTIIPSVASENVNLNPVRNENLFTVISVGRFVPLKGFDLTIRSFASFHKTLSEEEKPKVRLTLIGKGPSLVLLKKIITEEKISGNVEIIEWLPRNQLSTIYSSANVFLFPSHEGAGMVVAEAMSYGLPVVCLDNAGPGEFSHPGSGLKVPYRSYNQTVNALANKLSTLYNDKSIYKQECELSAKRFKSDFSWDVRGEQLKEIYAQQ